ncbi:hypothetical protein [Sphingomonas mollis]|uniref:hypothetical protein n=1 Tax=Sphingomonas mollis TaxID=2795726 RepID=UPI0018ED31BF|nr:hypothetical protein [Sphingomonas sp. BT553]
MYEYRALKAQVRELQRLLGKKTMERFSSKAANGTRSAATTAALKSIRRSGQR